MSEFMLSAGGELAALWLGERAGQEVQLLPLAFVAFTLYYLTEVLFQAIEASGWSYYSADVQIGSVSVAIDAFLAFKDNSLTAILAALWSGFAIIIVSKFKIF